MNFIHRSIAIVGIATVLAGIPLTVLAQQGFFIMSRMNTEELFERGIDKIEKGDYREAIEGISLAINKYSTSSKRFSSKHSN